jgi:hypothetical protein
MAAQQAKRVQNNQDLWDRIWRDTEGNVVIWQRPNIPQIAWIVLTIISIVTNGIVSDIFWYGALAALTVWSFLEIFKGDNYFRRVLGVFVLVLIIAACFRVGY